MIIGSTAIKHWFPDFTREPKDLDYITSEQFPIEESGYFNRNTTIKIEILNNPVLQHYVHDKYSYIPKYCPVNELYTLKISHCFWDLPNKTWDKHMWDIQFLKSKGCVFIPELFNDLYKYWNTLHGVNKRSNLDMSADEFFDNFITFPVEHDTLHELLIQHEYFVNQDKPTYTKILIGEVLVSEDKFNLLTEQEKFNLVFEEVAVMALERYSDLYYKAAYNKMLKKFIINHAPMFEAVWIIQNHKKLLTEIPFNFIKHLNEKINS